jgi:hypothetical protein
MPSTTPSIRMSMPMAARRPTGPLAQFSQLLDQQHHADTNRAANHCGDRRAAVHDIRQNFSGCGRKHDAGGKMLDCADKIGAWPRIHGNRGAGDRSACRDQCINPCRSRHKILPPHAPTTLTSLAGSQRGRG